MRAPGQIGWLVGGALSLVSIAAASVLAQAQNFPNRTIKVIIGPSPDIFSRLVAEPLQKAWGQPVVVEPRPGAGGKLAAQAVSSAAPDGYTMLFATPTYTLNMAMGTASWDIMKEFDPVALIGLISYVLVVNPNVPVHSVKELVDYAKANPGKLNCASAGIGTVPHLACEYLNKVAGINIVHVPYRDVNSGTMATVAGTTQLFFGVSTSAKSQIDGGSLRGLAVSTAKRSLLLPNLPTMVESGYPSFDVPGWGGWVTAAGTPKDVVEKLNAEVQRIVSNPDISKHLIAVGMEPPPPATPEQVREFVANDVARWTKFVEAVGRAKLTGGAQ